MRIITADEVANYVVCPEAWRLRYVAHASTKRGPATADGTQIRAEWTERQDLSSQLRNYAKIAYMLLVCLVIIVFMLEQRRSGWKVLPWGEPQPTVDQSATRAETPAFNQKAARNAARAVPTEIVLLLLVLGVLIFIWDLFERRSAKLRQEGGLAERAEVISAKGSSQLPDTAYRSNALGLASKPHAITKMGKQIIPVDLQPHTNKIRDRHVIPMIVHMRLIEESEGERPSHGVLLMGRKKRRVEIKNTDDKQRWLDSLLDEMRSIMDGVPAVPAPARLKCKHCDVRAACEHSAYKTEGEDPSRQ